eukprot:2744317-Prymnesium_polylepis.2
MGSVVGASAHRPITFPSSAMCLRGFLCLCALFPSVTRVTSPFSVLRLSYSLLSLAGAAGAGLHTWSWCRRRVKIDEPVGTPKVVAWQSQTHARQSSEGHATQTLAWAAWHTRVGRGTNDSPQA